MNLGLNVLEKAPMTGIMIFLIILGAALLIGGIALLIYFLLLRPKLKKDDKPTEEQILREEMDRVLKPIDDEETAKAVEQYKDEDE